MKTRFRPGGQSFLGRHVSAVKEVFRLIPKKKHQAMYLLLLI